jgi:PAS domain S-box-containing protein
MNQSSFPGGQPAGNRTALVIHHGSPSPAAPGWSPARLLLAIVSVAFAVEAVVMLVMPALLPAGLPMWLQALADAGLLAVLSGPLLWWLVIQPLRRATLMERTRAEAILESTTDAIITIDASATMQSWNAAAGRMFGYHPEDILGRSIWVLLTAAQRDEEAALLARYLRAEDAGLPEPERELEGLRQDGTTFPMALRISAFSYRGKRMFVGAARDITERRRQEEQARDALRMESVGRLAGGIAHDFNNLLTVVVGHASLMLSQAAADHPFRESIQEIANAAGRAAKITYQLLAFGRRQMLQEQETNVNALVAGQAGELRRLMGARVELVMRLDPGLGFVRVDPTILGRVIEELAVNASEALPEGGVVTIETANVDIAETTAPQGQPAKPGAYVALTVRDTGPGMPAEVKARVFEPYFTTKDRAGTGVGFGLSMAYGFAKQSGGDLWVESAPGRGTAVIIWLPRVGEPVEAAALAPATEAVAGEGATVLLVDDERAVRALTRRVLQRAGYRVLEAGSGEEALRAAAGFPGRIDLLLTDAVMPGLNGRELAGRLLAEGRVVHVLYMSGYAGSVMIQQGILAADAAVLQKPFAVRDLLEKVAQRLGVKGARAR